MTSADSWFFTAPLIKVGFEAKKKLGMKIHKQAKV